MAAANEANAAGSAVNSVQYTEGKTQLWANNTEGGTDPAHRGGENRENPTLIPACTLAESS